ncbi:MAG: acyl-CoA dehydrogenase [Rhodospirillales bacterium]|nr:acyl-CoA dehydrogenase [Rhodospirillales bacterium]
MTAYQAPLDDMRFVLRELAGLDDVSALPGFADATPDLIDAILVEAGKLASDVLAPLNPVGDREGCVLENGAVRTPKGFAEAYAQFVEGGWNGVPFDPEYGGMGLPMLVAGATFEIWQGANMGFAICPTLTQAAVELLSTHGSDELRAIFMNKLVSGEWTGTMNLTESQAGSDLSQVRTRAVHDGAQYRITGQKIFITYGEHDYTDNIIHMVLARSPDGPEGVKGLSLYVVPKFLVRDDGGLGDRNDIRCLSLEHKMGIHASPTCVLAFGEAGDGAIGYLVGEENHGLQYMFTMMNNARLAIGIEGVGVSEHAYQHALAYASERIQGQVSGPDGEWVPATIDRHPDVRRMLLSMRARTEAIRAVAYYTGAALDIARHHPDTDVRAQKQALVDMLIPVVKAWSTDTGIDVANTAVQVFGGAGYIEESGAPQFLRDVRITAIYEGTNGIQALDLVGRKVARNGGAAARALMADMRSLNVDLSKHSGVEDLSVIQSILKKAIDALEEATAWIVDTYPEHPDTVAASAAAYLELMATTTGGWLMARAALAAHRRLDGGENSPFLREKMRSSRFFADQILVRAPVLSATVIRGWAAVMRTDDTAP